MQVPLELTFRHMEPSEAMEANIREKVEKLEQFTDVIMACRVVIDAPHQHKNKGSRYHVRIDLTVPGGEIVVSREPELNRLHEDVYVAIRDSFDAARRQLEDFVRREKRKVKHHEVPLHGRISELHPETDSGRIDSADGRDIYFHRNSITNAPYEELEVGSEVRFDMHPKEGDDGPQASTVTVVGKHHVIG